VSLNVFKLSNWAGETFQTVNKGTNGGIRPDMENDPW